MRILGEVFFLSLLAGKLKTSKPSLLRERVEQKKSFQVKQ